MIPAPDLSCADFCKHILHLSIGEFTTQTIRDVSTSAGRVTDSPKAGQVPTFGAARAIIASQSGSR
jgi:hypothetical protein